MLRGELKTWLHNAHCSMECLKSKNEEADMKIILHAINAKDEEQIDYFIVTGHKCFSTVSTNISETYRTHILCANIEQINGHSKEIQYLHYWEHSYLL